MLPAFPTIAALHEAYAAGLAPGEVLTDLYRRLATVSDPGIFITLLPEDAAHAAARTLGDFDPGTKPLWGVPFAVKDNIDVAGLPTTAACPGFAYTPAETAFAVERLLDAGAILIGKTNLDQFATGLVGVRTPYPVPKNVFNPVYVPGGSSSGSALAVAHGLVTFALGTDTAGSGRVPAALNNIIGLKPSLGTVSSRGVVPACRTLDTISVFAGTVADAEAVYRFMAGHDPEDPWSRIGPVSMPSGGLPPGVRVGVPDASSRRFGGDRLSEAAFDASLGDLAALIVEKPREVDMGPVFEVAALLYGGPWVAERYQAIRALIETTPELLHPITRQIIGGATAFSAADAFEGFYRLAELRRHAQAIWNSIDVLAVPTYPRPRTIADIAADPIGPNSELGIYTNFVNLLDLCALAVPGRFRADGLPSGITLIGPHGHDGLLAALGARLHAAGGANIGKSAVPVTASSDEIACAAAPGEIELVVVGAHLSGMPLNRELTSRNARFLRAVPTLPEYRLFALPGGPPFRPGLMRVAPGEGTAIVTEVWAISHEGFGSFVAGIPAPLGIGTTKLADGTTPKGFIVEAEGIKGARDISSFGGWRAYMKHLSG